MVSKFESFGWVRNCLVARIFHAFQTVFSPFQGVDTLKPGKLRIIGTLNTWLTIFSRISVSSTTL